MSTPNMIHRWHCRAVVGAVLSAMVSATAVAADRPNILFLMADQFRGDCLGADGNKIIHTPNIDRLAAEGARFRCAYTSTPSCTPARSGLLTGLSPWHHGMVGYGRVAEKYPREMPAMLHDAGYYALGIGKMHFHPQRCLHGFDMTILDESGREESVADVAPDRSAEKRRRYGRREKRPSEPAVEVAGSLKTDERHRGNHHVQGQRGRRHLVRLHGDK